MLPPASRARFVFALILRLAPQLYAAARFAGSIHLFTLILGLAPRLHAAVRFADYGFD
jgi:hypothetical protein